jgi:hypothetical protein
MFTGRTKPIFSPRALDLSPLTPFTSQISPNKLRFKKSFLENSLQIFQTEHVGQLGHDPITSQPERDAWFSSQGIKEEELM